MLRPNQYFQCFNRPNQYFRCLGLIIDCKQSLFSSKIRGKEQKTRIKLCECDCERGVQAAMPNQFFQSLDLISIYFVYASRRIQGQFEIWKQVLTLKDIRAHCSCASLVHTLFIRHKHAMSFSSTCTESKPQQNIELMTFALTWCANIFVGCSVTPPFFSADHFLFQLFSLY